MEGYDVDGIQAFRDAIAPFLPTWQGVDLKAFVDDETQTLLTLVACLTPEASSYSKTWDSRRGVRFHRKSYPASAMAGLLSGLEQGTITIEGHQYSTIDFSPERARLSGLQPSFLGAGMYDPDDLARGWPEFRAFRRFRLDLGGARTLTDVLKPREPSDIAQVWGANTFNNLALHLAQFAIGDSYTSRIEVFAPVLATLETRADTRISQASGQNPDAVLQVIADSGSTQHDRITPTQTQRSERIAKNEPGEIKMVQGSDGTFIPEQQTDTSQRTEVGRIMVENTEIPVYSDTELLSLSRASEIVYQTTGHAANLQELQTIIDGMESLNGESFPDDDVYNRGLAVVMRELEYFNSDIPVVVENGAIVDGKPINTEVLLGASATVERPTTEELEEAWQLMANTSRGKVMEMLTYLQDYKAVATGNFEPYQKIMPESKRKELTAKIGFKNPETKLSPRERWKKAETTEKFNQDLQQLRDELNSFSPAEIQARIEEFVGLNRVTSEQSKQDAKALAETVAQMVNTGRTYDNQELQDIAAYYYGAFRKGQTHDETSFLSVPTLYFLYFGLLDGAEKYFAKIALLKGIHGEKHLFFSPGEQFSKMPLAARMVIIAHEFQHCKDRSLLLKLNKNEETDTERFVNSTITEMNAHMYAYRIYQQLQQHYPDFKMAIEDEYAEFIREKGSALDFALSYC